MYLAVGKSLEGKVYGQGCNLCVASTIAKGLLKTYTSIKRGLLCV